MTQAAAPSAVFSFLKKPTTSTPTSTASSNVFAKIATPATNGTKVTENGLVPSTSITKLSDSLKPTITSSKSASVEEAVNNNKKLFETSSEYYAKLKGLNQSVSQWIKTHVDSNAFCILTPIFRDYERYLKEIETQYGKSSSSSSTSSASAEEKADANKSKNISQAQSTESAKASTSDPKPASIFGSTKTKNIFGGTASSQVSSLTKESTDSKEAQDKLDIKTNNDKDKDLDKDKDKNKDQADNKLENKSLTFPQASSLFSFGQSNTGAPAASFSFGGAKSFSFVSNVVSKDSKDDNDDKEDEDEPPKVEIKPITEDGAIYEKRCKVFFKNKETGAFSDRGIGVLFLKPTPNGKTQLIVRAETTLGNLLLNTLLTKAVPTKKVNKNTVMLMCLPLADSVPPPVPVYLRVKTSEDADALQEALENNKK